MSVLVEPRVFAVPAAYSTLGERAVAFARRVGLGLDPEQEFVLAASLGLREDGRWASFEIGLNAPRQNGKGEILMARELFGLFELGEMFVVHSAHEFKTSERHFGRAEAAVRACPELFSQVRRSASGRVVGFRYSHGDEAIELQSGATIEFRTRTPSGMRGFDDVALLVLDEAMILSEAAHGSMLPTVRASKSPRGPQIIYAGSAADQEVHDKAVVWARVRSRGLAGDDPSLTYVEWSLAYDHPDQVPDEVVADPQAWRTVNWAIGRGRVLEEHMQRELRSLGRRQFLVELCGVGDYPSIEDGPGLFDMDKWASLAAPPLEWDNGVIAFDISPMRTWGSVVAAKKNGAAVHVGLLAREPGTGWLVSRIADLAEQLRPAKVICDERGPGASLVDELDREGVEVELTNGATYARACGVFYDAYDQGTLRHDGAPELAAAAKGAAQRTLGDAWAWSRRNSTGDITPLVAATIAVQEAAAVRPRRKPMMVVA